MVILIWYVIPLIYLPVVLKAQSNQVVNPGSITQSVTFPAGKCFYSWINDNPLIGLPANGLGNIASFTAINNTTTTLTANITAIPLGYAYVPNSTDSTVSVISPNLSVISTIKTGVSPIGVAISPDGTQVYVTDKVTGTISFINAVTDSVSAVVQGASVPLGIAVTADGNNLYVANSGSNDVWKINTITRAITPISIGHTSQIILISPDGSKIYAIYAGGISIISTANDTVSGNISTNASTPTAAVISPDGKRIYMTESTSANLISIDILNNSSQATYFGGNSSNGIAISPDGTKIYLALADINIIAVINTATNTEISIVGNGNQSSGNGKLSSLSLSPDGSLLYVTYDNGSLPGRVSIINTLDSYTIANVDVGAGPIPLGSFVKSLGCSTITFSITVNPPPPPARLPPLSTVYGTPSSTTSFIMHGTSTANGVNVKLPDGFEISSDSTHFVDNSNNKVITIGGPGGLDSMTVYVRLKQTAPVGTYSGTISLVSAAGFSSFVIPASTITRAPLIIAANDIVKTYGKVLTGGPGITAYIASGLKNGETTGSVTIIYGAGATATDTVGIYGASITPSLITGGTFTPTNYTISYQKANINVTPTILTVIADNKSKIYGDVNPVLTISYSGFVNNEGVAQLITKPTITTAVTQASAVGTYPITVSGGSAQNYSFNYVNGVITINPASIIIPNAFTPNNDGINDTWNIGNLDTYSKTTVEVLNRYGTRVYFSYNYPIPWDGRHNGGKVPEGTYYYIITGVNSKPVTGYVAVIR